MAENKKSFVLYADLIHTVKKMPKNKAGELLLTILAYVNDENPVINDLLISLVFEPIKQQLKRDLIKYETIKAKRIAAGREGGIKSGKVRKITCEANEANASFGQANEAVNVSGNVNGNASQSLVKSKVVQLEIDKIVEYLSIASDRELITNSQIKDEAGIFQKRYEGKPITNLKALCNTWASNIKPWQKKDGNISSWM